MDRVTEPPQDSFWFTATADPFDLTHFLQDALDILSTYDMRRGHGTNESSIKGLVISYFLARYRTSITIQSELELMNDNIDPKKIINGYKTGQLYCDLLIKPKRGSIMNFNHHMLVEIKYQSLSSIAYNINEYNRFLRPLEANKKNNDRIYNEALGKCFENIPEEYLRHRPPRVTFFGEYSGGTPSYVNSSHKYEEAISQLQNYMGVYGERRDFFDPDKQERHEEEHVVKGLLVFITGKCATVHLLQTTITKKHNVASSYTSGGSYAPYNNKPGEQQVKQQKDDYTI